MTKTSTKTSFELFIKWCEKHNKPTNKPETLKQFLDEQTFFCEGCCEYHFKEGQERFESLSGDCICEECIEDFEYDTPLSIINDEYNMIDPFRDLWRSIYTQDFKDIVVYKGKEEIL